jgi:hypothetical protein
LTGGDRQGLVVGRRTRSPSDGAAHDPQTGAIRRTIESNRFVTGVSWVDGELWHGTSKPDESELRRVDPHSAQVLQSVSMPRGMAISGIESDGANQ